MVPRVRRQVRVLLVDPFDAVGVFGNLWQRMQVR